MSGRQARSKSTSAPGLGWRVVIHTTCSSTVASSLFRRGDQPLGAIADSNPLSGEYSPAARTLTAHSRRPNVRRYTALTAAIADDLRRWVAAGPFHPSFRAHENAEAQLAIHAAAWFSHQYLADTGNVRMAGGRPGQEHSQAAAPVGGSRPPKCK